MVRPEIKIRKKIQTSAVGIKPASGFVFSGLILICLFSGKPTVRPWEPEASIYWTCL